MAKIDPSELRRLRTLIIAQVNAIPPMDIHKRQGTDFEADRIERDRWHRAMDAIVAELVELEGAKVKNAYDGQAMELAGIRCSCTYGSSGLLANWRAAAARRLEAMGEPS